MNKIVFKLTTAVSTAILLTGSVASVAFGTTSVTVTGNGADSNNKADVDVTNSNAISQTNNANITNNVSISSKTGGNKADKNTGGDTSIDTGDANVGSSVSNSANSNVASIACGCTGDADVKIAGNGADSDNTAKVDLSSENGVAQENNANVKNNIDVDSKTGDNEADKNTNGDVSVSTGDASADVTVDNMLNQNVLQLGGGNGGSLDVTISGNGADSDNKANVDVTSSNAISQENNANVMNDVDVDASTGYNEANKNTGGDTSIDTGDSDVTVGVTNKANSNVLDLSDCDCTVDASVKIADNGADSDNKVNFDTSSELGAAQENNATVKNDNDVDSKSGGNVANENTMGGSDPAVETGDAGTDVSVSTDANSNVLGDMSGDLSLPSLPDMGDLNGWIMLLMGHFTSH
jgi:hypothetical protein